MGTVQIPDPAHTDRDLLPIRGNLFDEICQALPEHCGSFFPFAKNHITDGTFTDLDLYYGIAMFVRSTYQTIASRVEFVHDSFRFLVPGNKSEHLPLSRNAQFARILRPDNQSIVVGHMHGLWDPAGKMDTPARDRQAKKFSTLAASMQADERTPMVLCGDFNLLPNSKFFEPFRSTMGFHELVTEGHYKSTRTSLYTGNPKKKGQPLFADYMLVNGETKVEDFQVIFQPEVSDHCPLVLDIE
jgi:endonuclease/exonuclease/phosphatase family metal-dependent hydrolase